MKKQSITMRWFKCPECGAVSTAPKKSSRRTKIGHVKTMRCWKCQKVQQFEQIE